MNIRLAICLLCLLAATPALRACPFCTAESQTLTEELEDADAAIIARLLKPELTPDTEPAEGVPAGTIDPETGNARFTIERVIKNPQALEGVERIEAIFFGDPDFESRYLIRGIGDPAAGTPLDWAIPLPLSPTAVEYIDQLKTLPESGGDRLAFFQDYLEHEDPMLGQDAYDEFARAPYDDLKELADRIDRLQLLEWIESPSVSPSRRRLFFTMLGVAGKPEDIPRLEKLIESDSRVLVPAATAMIAASLQTGGPLTGLMTIESVKLTERRRKLGLDAMIACYLTLHGQQGLDLIDRRFLADPKADYSHIYSALMALRFLASETDLVPQPRINQSARLLLDNADFADQVIPDLARWDDWEVLDKLVAMYRQAGSDDVSLYVREPIVTYLDVAAEQSGPVGEQAQAALAELEPLDPEVFRRARTLMAFGLLSRARDDKGDGDEGDDEKGDKAETDSPDAESVDTEPATTEQAPAENEPSQKEPEAIPDPASFGRGSDADQSPIATAGPETNKLDTGQDLETEEPNSDPQQSVAASRPIPAGAKPPVPPSTATLIAIPLAAVAGCYSLFWLILRSGSA